MNFKDNLLGFFWLFLIGICFLIWHINFIKIDIWKVVRIMLSYHHWVIIGCFWLIITIYIRVGTSWFFHIFFIQIIYFCLLRWFMEISLTRSSQICHQISAWIRFKSFLSFLTLFIGKSMKFSLFYNHFIVGTFVGKSWSLGAFMLLGILYLN